MPATSPAAAAPQFSAASLGTLIEQWTDAPCTLTPLPSYCDFNVLVAPAEEASFVLKVAHPDTSQDRLLAENALLDLLSPELPTPRVRLTSSGNALISARDELGRAVLARAISVLPGVTLAQVVKNDALMRDIGQNLGRLSLSLQDFTAAAFERVSDWDLDRGLEVARVHGAALPQARKTRLMKALDLLEDRGYCGPSAELERSVLHGDLNDHNLLVAHQAPPVRPESANAPDTRAARFEANRLTGILDFGDAVKSSTINELAIALAYGMFGASRCHANDPLARALPLVAGYHQERPLSEPELAVLFPRALLRLGVSVAMSAHEASRRRGDRHQLADQTTQRDLDYLSVSEASAWKTLGHYWRESTMDTLALWRRCELRLRAACGLEPVRGARALQQAVGRAPVEPILGRPVEYQLLDLSFGAKSLVGYDPSDEPALTQRASRRLGTALDDPKAWPNTTRVGWGRYAEPRALYVGSQYRAQASGTEDAAAVTASSAEPRTVHLGVDLFAPPETPIHAPLAGQVHSFADNAIANDYGPTILLEHQLDGRSFWTLYGHLSRQSLSGLEPGQEVAAGDQIATLGSAAVNGGWTPHLHFQLILDDLGYEGTFPGVGEATQMDVWRSICPDPNLLIRWKHPDAKPMQSRRHELWARRRGALAPSLSLAYERPLHITWGRAQHLFEANGHQYLDLVNNVAHVGHANQRVVSALCQQAAALNTNSRYLHRNVVDYAERLLATVPQPRQRDPLEVCFFVNSGSEANDLALRMARAFTARTAIACLEGAYHGHLTSTVEVSPYKHDGPGGQGTPKHVLKASMPDTYRGRFRGTDAAARYTEELQALMAERPVAAFIAEPILSCGGQIVPPDGYLERAFAAVRAQGGVTIADEVQVGFGRVGSHFWAFDAHGVVPDIVTVGKPIGNGHPLAAVLTTRAIADSFANGMEYFNTYGGNPVSCAVGLAVLDEIEERGLQQRAMSLGALFHEGLEELRGRHSAIGDVRGAGLFLGFELVKDRGERTPDPELTWYLTQWMRERGVLLSTDGPQHNVVKIKPPMVLDEHDIEATLRLLDAFFHTVALR